MIEKDLDYGQDIEIHTLDNLANEMWRLGVPINKEISLYNWRNAFFSAFAIAWVYSTEAKHIYMTVAKTYMGIIFKWMVTLVDFKNIIAKKSYTHSYATALDRVRDLMGIPKPPSIFY